MPDAIPFLVPFAAHPSDEVRFDATWALGCYAREQAAAEVLERLIDDPDKEVRDWAIFGAGVQSDADSESLRERFMAHLDDPYLDARIEAAASLAKRHDRRVVAPLITLLHRDGLLRGYIEAAESILGKGCPDNWQKRDYVMALTEFLPK